MEAAAAISMVLTVINTLAKLEPEFVATWNNLKPFATALYSRFTGETISDADLATLEAQIDALHAAFQEPLPE